MGLHVFNIDALMQIAGLARTKFQQYCVLLEAHKWVRTQILGTRTNNARRYNDICQLNIHSLCFSWILRTISFQHNTAAMKTDSNHCKVLLGDPRLAIVEGRQAFGGTLFKKLKRLE